MLAAPEREPVRLDYSGEGFELFKITLANALLSILTLGIYHAWGRARQLRYTIGSVRAQGDPLVFSGEGRELFLGLVRVTLLFVVPILALYIIELTMVRDPGYRVMFMLVVYALVLTLSIYAPVGSLRYRARRTRWRAIGFGFDGDFTGFFAGYAPRLLLVFFTFGLAYPFASCWRRDYVLGNSRFGSASFSFHGAARDLIGTWIVCWLLAIPTLGLSLVWYHGRQQEYFWNHTSLGAGRFQTSLDAGRWIWLAIGTGLLVMVTFGIATPWAYVRVHREFFTRLRIEGLDLAAIEARAASGSVMGEALTDALDLDAGVDIG